MINKEIQDYIDYLLFLKYDRQLVWSNTTIAKMSDKHLVNAIKYLEQHNPNRSSIKGPWIDTCRINMTVYATPWARIV